MIWSWTKTILGILALFLFFLFITFPFERIGPRLAKGLESAVVQTLRIPEPQCELLGFALALPFSIKVKNLRCIDNQNREILALSNLRLTPFPFRQTLQAEIGDGRLSILSNFSPLSQKLTHLQVEMQSLDIQKLSASFLPLLQKSNPFIPPIELVGTINGKLDIPLTPLHQSSGLIDLNLQGFKIPSQRSLESFGISEVTFSQSVAKLQLTQGRLEITDFGFLSDLFSTKATGSFQFNQNFDASNGNIELKWKIVASDALRNNPFGSQLLRMDCPNPDAQGFCTRRMSRVSDFSGLLSGSSGF